MTGGFKYLLAVKIYPPVYLLKNTFMKKLILLPLLFITLFSYSQENEIFQVVPLFKDVVNESLFITETVTHYNYIWYANEKYERKGRGLSVEEWAIYGSADKELKYIFRIYSGHYKLRNKFYELRHNSIGDKYDIKIRKDELVYWNPDNDGQSVITVRKQKGRVYYREEY